MTAEESVRPSGGVARTTGLRTTLAVLLLGVGVVDLVAIDTVLLPRYLASRSPRSPGARVALPAPPWRPPSASPSLPRSTPSETAPIPGPASAGRASPLPAAPPAGQAAGAVAATAPGPTAAPPPPMPDKAEPPDDKAEPPEQKAGIADPDSEGPTLRFARGAAWLSAESRQTLERLADRLKEDADLQAVLDGHTDDLGPAKFNDVLSRSRALQVRRWLVGRGVDANRIEIRSFGSSQPAVEGQSREARAQNRRVEILLRERSL